MARTQVCLVSMPWAEVFTPSIQMGTLHACLDRAGFTVRSCSAYVAFAELMLRARPDARSLTLADYRRIAESLWVLGAGEWVFSVAPLVEASVMEERDVAYRRYLVANGLEEHDIVVLDRLRELVPEFLQTLAEEVLRDDPVIVGLTSTFSQNVPSLALAATLKAIRPDVVTVFGGANLEFPMGRVLFDAYPVIDVAVDGEGENVLPELVARIVAGRPLRRSRRVLARWPQEDEELADATVDLDRSPTPTYDEYFATLAASRLEVEHGVQVRLPFESARGCWWGAKHHCTFCGLNGATMAFRAKTAERAFDELEELTSKYAVHRIAAVDNIIDLQYTKSLLPRLAASTLDLDIGYETKANLSFDQLSLMRAAGINFIQPGIESLDTTILKIMKKGTTALQNVRLLKWCAMLGIEVSWNILYGFATEDPAAYAKMASLAPSLFHLGAPNITGVLVNRNSPMFNVPHEHGIALTGPLGFYRHVYPGIARRDLDDLAYFFDHRYEGNRAKRDIFEYTAALRQEVEDWRLYAKTNAGALKYRVLGDVVRVEDHRSVGDTSKHRRYVLRGVEAAIFLGCEDGATLASLCRALERRFPRAVTPQDVREFCEQLIAANLMCHLDDRYLSLALRDVDPRRRRTTSPAVTDGRVRLVLAAGTEGVAT